MKISSPNPDSWWCRDCRARCCVRSHPDVFAQGLPDGRNYSPGYQQSNRFYYKLYRRTISTYCTDVAKVTAFALFSMSMPMMRSFGIHHRIGDGIPAEISPRCIHWYSWIRKYGHNEGDEPRSLNRSCIKAIAEHPNARYEVYNAKLLSQGEVEANLAKRTGKGVQAMLHKSLDTARQGKSKKKLLLILKGLGKDCGFLMIWFLMNHPQQVEGKTSEIGMKISTLPADKILQQNCSFVWWQKKLVSEGKADWAMAELLAYGSLLKKDFPFASAGRDVERNFSRHAVIRVEDSEEQRTPLSNSDPKGDIFHLQFTAFWICCAGIWIRLCNGSPIHFNDLGSTVWRFHEWSSDCHRSIYLGAEDKWNRMERHRDILLPSWLWRTGAEHSGPYWNVSWICVHKHNMQVINCTTLQTSFMHCVVSWRDRSVNSLFFRRRVCFVIHAVFPHWWNCLSGKIPGGDRRFICGSKQIGKVVVCSGKSLLRIIWAKEKDQVNDIALVRLEQFYPLPAKQLKELKKNTTRRRNGSGYRKNLWTWVHGRICWGRWRYSVYCDCVRSGASPTGSHKAHERSRKNSFKKYSKK